MRAGRRCDATETGLPVDMLSPGAMVSSRVCSMGWGLVLDSPGAVGGCGGGRLGLCLGLGAGRDLVSVPVSEGGEDRECAAPGGGGWPGEDMVA